MRKAPTTLAIALATALLSPASTARAATPGEVMSLSAIGAPFRAEIRLSGDLQGNIVSCLRVGTGSDHGDGLAWLTQASISVIRDTSPRLIVSSTQRINEPIVKLALEDVCETRLRREYTLLLPYPKVTAPTAAPAASPRRQQTAPPVQASSPDGSSGRTWTTAPGESLESLAYSLYPDNTSARRRFMRATASANPSLFETAADQTRPLPAGTALTVPDLRRLAASTTPPQAKPKATPAHKSTPASPARTPLEQAQQAAPQQPPPPSTSDRLVVAGDADARGSTRPSAASPSLDALSEREREVAAAIDRSIVAEMELLERIRQLEETRAQLEARIQALALSAASAPAPTSPANSPAPVADHRDSYLLGGLGAAVLLLTLLLLHRRRVRQPAEQPSTLLNTEAPARVVPASARLEAPPPVAAPQPKAEPALDWRSPAADASTQTAAGKLPGDAPEEHESAIELAEIMMGFGRLHGAADTLSEFIRSNPKQAITPWLKLLEVYRAAGLRVEFDAIAKELNKTFNVTTVTWDNYDALRSNDLSIEQLPHIVERVQRTWRTRDCQLYLQQLLRDNRDGARAGFPFAVIDDILMLSAVLEEQLGPTVRLV